MKPQDVGRDGAPCMACWQLN